MPTEAEIGDTDALTGRPLQRKNPPFPAGSSYGRYWARTSDPQLVELVLSQLS